MSALQHEIDLALSRAIAPLIEKLDRLTELLERPRTEYVNQAEIGRILNLTPPAVNMSLRRGKSALAKLPFFKIDGRKMWRRADVEGLFKPENGGHQ